MDTKKLIIIGIVAIILIAAAVIMLTNSVNYERIEITPNGTSIEVPANQTRYVNDIESIKIWKWNDGVLLTHNSQENGYDIINLTGSGYNVVMTFTGQKPGRTSAHISCSSPIADNWERDYDITVDRNLNVTVKELPYVVKLRMTRGGFRIFSVYEVRFDGLDYTLHKESAFDDAYQNLRPDVNQKVMEIISKYDVFSWDGFDKDNRWVLDGEDFTFKLVLSDGTDVYATGSNKFPNNYRDVFFELEALFEDPGYYL